MSGPVTAAVDLVNEVAQLKQAIRIKDQKIAMLERESLVLLQNELNDWQAKTFPVATPLSIYTHMQREMEELGEDFAAPELVDVLVLLCHLAGRCGYDLLTEMRNKLPELYARKWQAPDAEGVVEHRRDLDR